MNVNLDIKTFALGLIGEIGSAVTIAKKKKREISAACIYRERLVIEFGDILWYFNALCVLKNIDLRDTIIIDKPTNEQSSIILPTNHPRFPTAIAAMVESNLSKSEALAELNYRGANLSKAVISESLNINQLFYDFGNSYLACLKAIDINLNDICNRNISKIQSRFSNPDYSTLPDFDETAPDIEKLPFQFEVEFIRRYDGKTVMRMNDIFIGDPLSDNITEQDGYKLHDVFHYAYVSVLGWSPVIRSLLKRKRKHDKSLDENQDGGRAIVVEEGVTALIFQYAKQINYFEGESSVPLELLDVIERFVDGYEVASLPLKMWERAILQGYSAFRELRAASGEGILVGNRSTRTLQFKHA